MNEIFVIFMDSDSLEVLEILRRHMIHDVGPISAIDRRVRIEKGNMFIEGVV